MTTREMTSRDSRLREMLKQANGQTFVLTEDGRPVAAVVPIDDVDAETLSLGTNPKFLRILRRSVRQLDKGQSVSLEEMKKRVGARRRPAAMS